MIAAGVCIVAAVVLLWRGDFNAAFVAAVLGLVAWFLNYRLQATQGLAAHDVQDGDEREGDEDSDENQD